MGVLDTALQWLRPFVQTKTWDYCVVWKLGDDPSRYIEWVGCCCAGGYGDHINNFKEEKAEGHNLLPLCRDTYIKHLVKTKTCRALSHFPSSIPLYSGIHGEIVLSSEPKWLNFSKDSNPNPYYESTGTQVLIPVIGGLIELFSSKHILQDEKVIEFVIAQYNSIMKQEAITSPGSPLPGKCLKKCPARLQDSVFSPRLSFLSSEFQPSHHPSIEGSSTGSNPSNEPQFSNPDSVHASPHVSVNGTIKTYPSHKKFNDNRNLPSKQELGIGANYLVKKSRERMEREGYQSKNLVTERNRRNRIKDGLFTLRSLVPNISKMDRASILGDAIEYIEELQKKVKELQDELKGAEEEECNEKNDEPGIPKLGADKGTIISAPTELNQDPSTADEKGKMEVELEVHQIGTRDFLLKFFCKQKHGGFKRLMESMNSLGLEVTDANITTCKGKVLNIIKVEVNKREVQPKSLKDVLIQLIGKKSQN